MLNSTKRKLKKLVILRPFYTRSANLSYLFVATALLLISSGHNYAAEPHFQWSAHNVGNIQMTVTNWGVFGLEPTIDRPRVFDPFTGERLRGGLVYPRGSRFHYLEGRLAVGAVIGNDSLVTTLGEFRPDAFPLSQLTMTSNDRNRPIFSPDARSELDITTVYYDTLPDTGDIPFDNFNEIRPHTPLGIRVIERSMSWSADNIDDFVLIEYEIGNMNSHPLHELFVSIDAKAIAFDDVQRDSALTGGAVGFLKEWVIDEECGYPDDVDIAYTMSPTGKIELPLKDFWEDDAPRAAVGIRVMGLPKDSIRFNFNWFAGADRVTARDCRPFNWGPRRKPFGERLRSIGQSVGCPEGDNNKYYVMAHPEFDYDSWFGNVDFSNDGWIPPCTECPFGGIGFAGGHKVSQSFGPFEIRARGTIRFTIAVVGGDSVHVNPVGFRDLFNNPTNPQPFINQLDFSQLAENARWASWVYDNPGVDTDGDGFFGTFRMCNGDTFWIEGDGVPDFKADIPPPSPEVRVIPSEGKLTLRWNGVYSENIVDPFTRAKDFEGYRVYSGLDDRASSLSLLSSFDHLNFNMFKFIQKTNDLFVWENDDLPFSLDSLKVMFNDPNFDPLLWTRNNPLTLNDTLFRFEKQDFNQFDLTTRGGIRKVFPNAIDPGPDSLLWNDSDLVFDWDPPLPKFYEYEFEVKDLLPTVRQFVSVTAFDFGFPAGNIPPRESNKLNSITESFPQNNVDSVEQYNLDVYIYPNPYRIDGNYIERGFENRDGTQANQRAHRVHFVNLPRICKITIYSLDGDRIDSFEHNFPMGGPEAMHDEWDMITRNGLIPVSGIYYWVVEAEARTQMGKLIIIK